MPNQSLSVFFPMYNEKQNIDQTLDQAEGKIPSLGIEDYEILVIDDGSKDGSDEAVNNRIAKNPHIRLIRHKANMGYGAALRTGFNQANRDLVFYTDCDLPVDLLDIQRALPLLKEADLVIGFRVKRHESLRRAVYSRVYNFLMRILFGVHVRDVNFSFKLVHRRVMQRVQLTASTVFIDGQLLAEAVFHGFKIAEIPVDYTPRQFGSSNFDSIQTAWLTLKEMLAYWVLRIRRSAVLSETLQKAK